MEKEIGGYLGLERLSGTEYYTGMIKLNLGRTALLFALETLQVKKLYLPYYLCDSVMEICEKWQGQLQWYSVREDFTPSLPSFKEDGAYLYLVNYYGQLNKKKIQDLKKQYPRIILDNTHDFFQAPMEDIPTLYSMRKFFGIPDGAYLHLPPSEKSFREVSKELPLDISNKRMEHLLGRYEETGSAFYSSMLHTANTFHGEPVKRMSLLTENLLRGIDYEKARRQRCENYQILADALDGENPLHPNKPDGPFAYPYYVSNGPLLRRQLAAEQIYIPTYWNNVISAMPEDSLEYSYASNILPLPCDQRYSANDMFRMLSLLKKHQTEKGA